MNALHQDSPTPTATVVPIWSDTLEQQLQQACVDACGAIAPAWPLDRAIAVNPHWSRVKMPLRQVAARMALLGGIQVFPPREQLQQAWDQGRVTPADLDYALAQSSQAQQRGLDAAHCLAALASAALPPRLPLLIDVLDNDPQRHTRLSWRQAITHQVSQTCAAYFDQHQADWQPERGRGLYAFWRETLEHDHGIGLLMGLPHIADGIKALPACAREAERWVMQRLALPPEVWADYLESVLLTVNGWASWCAYLGWQAQLEGSSDQHLRELLAIRMAWGALLLECKDDDAASHAFHTVQQAWARSQERLQQAQQELLVDELWQLALEAGYQRQLASALRQQGAVSAQDAARVEVQAAFCIDVRSEPLRRALEAVSPGIQTLGFAGFFGLPVAYTPLATQASRPQLPGLLAPAYQVQDVVAPSGAADSGVLVEAVARARRKTLAFQDQWQGNTRWPGSAFSFVEVAGVTALGGLWKWLRPGQGERARDDLAGLPARYRELCRPQLVGVALAEKVALAERVLHAMGLDRQVAPLVLLVGHGSQTTNNAHAAALDCGACCGQTGEVNARTLAQLLNEREVRRGLLERQIFIPEDSHFLAVLHNTTTDEIEAFDLDLLEPAAQARWQALQPLLAEAGDRVRRERAPRLGLADAALDAPALLKQLRRRANDGAQPRPEWGLTGNAAFVIAPRARSRGLDLGGRCFLHDYQASQDSDGSVLELLMTAPMLVTHWINWQYHASTSDPARLGSGNKLLHNVVGGTIGVFEGNGGDLRIGLARQSLHDGRQWVHEPLRLTVVIDAAQEAIDAIVSRHAIVRQLLEHGWLHLWRFSEEGFEQWRREGWKSLAL
ncbi:YbcC family protein [Herbaspirillum rubrisubalbicans]|uniref:Probable inorganic carbon transporter subunit DabA n=1 Tax=Herbaspirillum rubrisubalbicans Os34 TaxID=1235827 RepID=A0A6M3ZUV8_9BURK|nr:DUF2309 domain-containing protein [Herbaspirillum rubrisubalbicans]QJQ01292.1 DUF2309 domain-containing protein [Herbaspirillum rubrisubalbicans Os34]